MMKLLVNFSLYASPSRISLVSLKSMATCRHSFEGSSSLRSVASSRGVQLGLRNMSFRMLAFLPIAIMLGCMALSVLLVMTTIVATTRVGSMVVIMTLVVMPVLHQKSRITGRTWVAELLIPKHLSHISLRVFTPHVTR
jgi:hypothetical protein